MMRKAEKAVIKHSWKVNPSKFQKTWKNKQMMRMALPERETIIPNLLVSEVAKQQAEDNEHKHQNKEGKKQTSMRSTKNTQMGEEKQPIPLA